MLLPLEESVCILMFALLLFSRSVSRFCRCNASVAPVLMEYSSASALDKAIVACVRLP